MAIAVISTSRYLVIGAIFPFVLVAFLLNFNPKPLVKFSFSSDHDIAYVGDEISLKAKVRIEEGFGLFFIRLPAVDTFELEGEETNVHLVFKGFRKVEEREYDYKLKALRRGVFRFPDISYSYYPPLSLSRSEHGAVPSDFVIKVLPKIQLLKRSQASFRSLHDIPRSSRARLGPHSTDFISIRDYSVGDPYKFINWKASSRLASNDKLLVNEYEREGLRTFLFVLDRGQSMRRGSVEENPLEYGIAFILSYAKILLNYGINVGVWLEPPVTSSLRSNHENCVIPSSGADHYQRIKELLVRTEWAKESLDGAPPFSPVPRPSTSLLTKIVNESIPSVIIVTNYERSNMVSVYNYVRYLELAGATSISIIDIIPYNIVTKYSTPFTIGGISSSASAQQGSLGAFLKSILISTKKKDHYRILPRTVRVIPWDPTSETIGRTIKISLAMAGQRIRRYS